MATVDNIVDLANVGDLSQRANTSARKTALMHFDKFLEYIFTKDSCAERFVRVNTAVFRRDVLQKLIEVHQCSFPREVLFFPD